MVEFGKQMIMAEHGEPLFDDQPTGSIGDVAVAPSNPNVIYVASGEGIQRPDLSVGDGCINLLTEEKHGHILALNDAQQIGGLAVDPKNENIGFCGSTWPPLRP